MDIVERLRKRAEDDKFIAMHTRVVAGDSPWMTNSKLLKKAADEIEELQKTIAKSAQLNARLMDIIDLAKRMKTAAFNHWCEKTPETNGILVDLQFEFEDALEGLKKDGHR